MASANHPLLTFDGWRRLDELSVGDPIAVARSLSVENVNERPDAAVALLGYLIGDGSVSAGVPRFTNSNPRVVADFTSWAAQMGAIVTSSPGSITYRVTRRGSTRLQS
jgi:replicative DNA helicase